VPTRVGQDRNVLRHPQVLLIVATITLGFSQLGSAPELLNAQPAALAECVRPPCCHASTAWLRAHFNRRSAYLLFALLAAFAAAAIGLARRLSVKEALATAAAVGLCFVPLAVSLRVSTDYTGALAARPYSISLGPTLFASLSPCLLLPTISCVART
jgi:hypothetical protein